MVFCLIYSVYYNIKIKREGVDKLIINSIDIIYEHIDFDYVLNENVN